MHPVNIENILSVLVPIPFFDVNSWHYSHNHFKLISFIKKKKRITKNYGDIVFFTVCHIASVTYLKLFTVSEIKENKNYTNFDKENNFH